MGSDLRVLVARQTERLHRHQSSVVCFDHQAQPGDVVHPDAQSRENTIRICQCVRVHIFPRNAELFAKTLRSGNTCDLRRANTGAFRRKG